MTFDSWSKMLKLVSLYKEFSPNMSKEERDKKYAGWLKAVERTKKWEE